MENLLSRQRPYYRPPEPSNDIHRVIYERMLARKRNDLFLTGQCQFHPWDVELAEDYFERKLEIKDLVRLLQYPSLKK